LKQIYYLQENFIISKLFKHSQVICKYYDAAPNFIKCPLTNSQSNPHKKKTCHPPHPHEEPYNILKKNKNELTSRSNEIKGGVVVQPAGQHLIFRISAQIYINMKYLD